MNTELTPRLPVPNLLTAPFWDACRTHRLVMQRCQDCGQLRFYPTAACPFCACEKFSWQSMSGRGHIYSWTRIVRSTDPAWARRTPYISVVVELEEQPGLLVPGLLQESELPATQAAHEVEVWFEDIEGFALPRWRLRKPDKHSNKD